MASIIEALQSLGRQTVDAIERTSSAELHKGDVDEIDPPDDIDELHYDVYEAVGIVNANVDQYVDDVFRPGVRVQADSDATEEFFEDEFLPQCGVIGGEKRQHFEALAPVVETQRLTRGTVLVNLLPNDTETPIPETEVSGFYLIPPETVTPLTYENKNILIEPEDLDHRGVTETKRGEAAAYAQFEDQSVLGRRISGFDRDALWFSQNDIAKATYNVDIGGDGSDESGIWGQSALRPIKEEAEEYEQAKRDRAAAIKTKAHGIWTAKFETQVLDLPNDQAEIREWDDSSIDDVVSELEGMGPGDILELDGPVILDKWSGEVPELDDTLRQLVDDILAPLPAPKYAVGFETDINQFVTEQQETRYQERIEAGRQYQENFWTDIFETVAESHGLDPSGLEVIIEPEEDESPVMSLSDEELDRMETWAAAFERVRGDVPADAVADLAEVMVTILQLPEDAVAEVTDVEVDESDAEVQDMADDLTGSSAAEADD